MFKVMKLIIFIMIISLSGLFASETYSQDTKLSLKVEKVSLENFLIDIENQSEFRFFYNGEINVKKKISGNFNNKKISEILDAVKEKAGIQYEIKGRQIILSPISEYSIVKSMQQQKKIDGKVTDSSGSPLPGVTVLIEGTTIGTITDSDGKYSLTKISPNAILTFSFIGMKSQKMFVAGKNQINVTMEDSSTGIDEVVAIGYGSVKKQNLTGSISRVRSDAFENRTITRVGEALSGKLAGVLAQQTGGGRPGQALTIKIRGIQSVNSSNTPLYVIDGIPGDIDGINSNDIASIDVLKDASSAAIYGARGGTGVILITTKGGKEGKPSINFNMSYGLQKVDNLMPMMNRDEYIAWNIYARNQGYLLSGGSLSDPMSMRGRNAWPEAWLNPSSLPDVNWQKAVLRTAPIQNYQLSASGGGKTGKYFISGSYITQDGIMKETDYKRATFKTKTSIKIGEKIELGMDLAPSISISNNPENTVSGVNLYSATTAPIVALDKNTEEWGYTEGATAGYPNPLELLKQVREEYRDNKITSNIWGKWDIIKALSFKSQFGYNFSNHNQSYFKPSNVYNGRNSYGSGYSIESYYWTLQNTITYTPKLSSFIDMNLLLGQGIEGAKDLLLSAKANGFSNDLVQTMNVATVPLKAESTESQNHLSSYFGRLLLNGLDKYLLTLNLRYDGSSKFGKNSKWGWFPSASVGWKINNENFMKSTSGWLNLLKLRALYGSAGNNGIGNYESIATMSNANYNLNGGIINGLAPDSFGNSNIGWETKISKGIGIDFSALNNRIQVNLDFYRDDIKDMLLDAPLSYMSGYTSVRQNLGKVRNKGWEFELTTRNIIGKFDWSTSINISRNTNEVKDLGIDDTPIITYYGGATTNITTIGKPIGSYYMYKVDGLLLKDDFDASGNPLVPILSGQIEGNVKIIDINNDGKINADDLTTVGDNQPDFTWGFTNNFCFKNFNLNIFLQGVSGGELFFSGARHLDLGQSVNGFNQFRRWARSYKIDYNESENPFPENMDNIDMSWDGKTPTRFGVNPIHNSSWIYDASYVRIKNITLGYTFPKNVSNSIGIELLKVFFSCENLYTWTDYPGNTPESNTMGNETTQLGSDYGTYPMARTYSIGVNINL